MRFWPWLLFESYEGAGAFAIQKSRLKMQQLLEDGIRAPVFLFLLAQYPAAETN
jgi:hypothetical protein